MHLLDLIRYSQYNILYHTRGKKAILFCKFFEKKVIFIKRTDLICENAVLNDCSYSSRVHSGEMSGTRYTDISVDEESTESIGLAVGRYITVYTDKGDVRACVSGLLKDMIPSGTALVAGLGNENICSDSLGTKALGFIPATAHLSECKDFSDLGMRKVCVVEAGVTGKTGIESSTRITSEAVCAGAELIIVIDSLACSEPERLCSVIQITDTGISPGSGVGNDRRALNKETAGVPVIAIGVPTVIDLDCITDAPFAKGFMVTPRNIDVSVHRLAGIIGRAVSTALNPNLTDDEIRSLIIY